MVSTLKITSVNCQGLRNKYKRIDVFDYLKNMNQNIYCLQDTHFTKEIENEISCNWGYECFFSSFRSNSRGVAILFNNNFDFKVIKEKTDNHGNIISLEILVGENTLNLVNIYGPNNDSPNFFANIFEMIEDFNSNSVIICGDFNLVLNPDIDYFNYLNINNPKATKTLLELMETHNLFDAYRELHPNLKRYTWRKKNPLKQSRLDFFLLSENLYPNLEQSNIENSYRSDHSSVNIALKLNNFIRGKGLWKFNNSLLNDSNYLTLIKETIINVIKEYAVPVYNFKNIQQIDLNEIQFTIDDQLFLETLLMVIRGKTISYSSYKKKEQNKREQNLINEIKFLESTLDNNNINNQIEVKKAELQKIREIKMNGIILRSKSQWIADGEKPTKFFCNLEKHNFTSKIIPRVEKDDGTIVNDQFEILHEIELFYKNLYSEDKNINDCDLSSMFRNLEISKLTKQESMNLEGLLTIQEAEFTLKKMKNGKSPGSDGYTAEFFKCFWKQIGHFIVRAINYGFIKNELSVTQKHGIITCLPKGNKPKQYLKNWRPLTLLNTIYKIASGSISNRIKKVLDKIIENDQTGFVSGRFIGENTRLVYDIMKYTEDKNIPGLLLLIDFEKAFDTISWNFIQNVLTFF